MKKIISVLLIFLLCAISCIPATAAQEGPVITLQPQNTVYSEDDVALYEVKAEGNNLSATWYMEWQGKTYTISDTAGGMQEWEGYAGEQYGPGQPDANTFTFLFEGIGLELNGAYIWCVIEDGHYDVTTQKALISVGEGTVPPRILDIPAQLTVEKGEEATLRCVAQAPGETQLSYLWYETDTGMLQDIRAVNRGDETADYLVCDTSAIGTRNYVCMVTTTEGGVAYSSVVPVTVIENAVPPAESTDPTEPVETVPDETVPDKTAPDKTAPDETVPDETVPADTAAPTAPTEAADSISGQVTSPVTEPQTGTGAQTSAPATAAATDTNNSTPWWIFVIVGMTAAGAGIGVAFLLVKKKK